MHGIRGSGRRGGGRRGGSNARRKAAEGGADAKTSLVAEWRAHEEDCAARLLQHQLRAFLSRQRLARLLASVYEKHYDPMRKQHYYVNTQTNASSWEKPRLLARFLPADRDVARGRVEVSPREAAQRIQRLVRAFLAWRTIRQLVRESYMKLFDEEAKTFFYLNTRTGERSELKPPFFRRQDDSNVHSRASTQTSRDDDDLEIEPFYFRKAVCKISSSSNPHGSGVLGRFCGVLCVLSDGQTLPDEDTARAAQVVCNLTDGRVPFPVLLASDVFFAGMKLQSQNKQQQLQLCSPSKASRKRAGAFDFTLCALNEEHFLLAAGPNVVPLKLELNDRKLGCGEAESLRLLEPLEVVGHPHGKRQVLHVRQLAKLEPNSINPQQLQYDRATETGAAGSAVFTRGGKLVGLQPFAPPKEPAPMRCWYIKPILDAALVLITPPEPVILTSNVSSTVIQVYWQLPREWQPLRGLPVHFELEVCRHAMQNPLRHDEFELAYLGPKHSHRIAELLCATMYSVRCRAVNHMKKSSWSAIVRFITLPQVSLAWRLRYCTSVEEAVKRMKQQRSDPHTQLQSVQWIFAQLEKRDEADRVEQQMTVVEGQHTSDAGPICSRQLQLEQELLACHGMELLFDSLAWFPDESATVTLLLRLFLKLTRFQRATQRFLTDATRCEALCGLLRSHAFANGGSNQQEELGECGSETNTQRELQIPLLCLELLGAVLDENASAKLVYERCDGVSLVLRILEQDPFRSQAVIAAECCYILSVFSFNNAPGKRTVVGNNGLALLQEVLQRHHNVSRVLYWALVALGNAVYASDEATELPHLQTESLSLGLVDSVCACRVHFLSRLQGLELELDAAETKLERLHATHVGEETRNELDASENLVETLNSVIAEWKRHDVAEAADYALRYLLTDAQRKVQAASQRFVRKFLQRTLSMAYAKWCEVTVFERHRAIFLMFVTTVRTRQLRPAFRRWEVAMREMRKHKTILQTLGSGLAIDLTKKKKERYRMLVLQK